MGEIEGCVPEEQEEDDDDINPLDDQMLNAHKFNSNRSKGKKPRIMSARNRQVGKLPEDEQLEKIVNDILDVLPDTDIDIETVMVLFPTKRENSMNTVLTQEVTKFNKLYDKIILTLDNIKKAQNGKMMLTEELQKARMQLMHGFIPDIWLAVSYPSLKPLASYIRDLALRIKTLRQWVTDNKAPEVFWMAGFFFTQSFLTAILQNFSRKYQVEIDSLQFEFEF